MQKNPDRLIEERRSEIMQAFYRLYATKNFNEINMKSISEETRFTRATIYNYFKNIDEIFICAYQQEYQSWYEDLEKILNGHSRMSKTEFAHEIAQSLTLRTRMLKLSTADFHERETNCRKEFVISHKKAFSATVDAFSACLHKFFPRKTDQEIYDNLYEFFPFLHGMYRYIDLTPIQITARKEANLVLKQTTVYDLTYNMVMQILK